MQTAGPLKERDPGQILALLDSSFNLERSEKKRRRFIPCVLFILNENNLLSTKLFIYKHEKK